MIVVGGVIDIVGLVVSLIMSSGGISVSSNIVSVVHVLSLLGV